MFHRSLVLICIMWHSCYFVFENTALMYLNFKIRYNHWILKLETLHKLVIHKVIFCSSLPCWLNSFFRQISMQTSVPNQLSIQPLARNANSVDRMELEVRVIKDIHCCSRKNMSETLVFKPLRELVVLHSIQRLLHISTGNLRCPSWRIVNKM